MQSHKVQFVNAGPSIRFIDTGGGPLRSAASIKPIFEK